MLIDRFLSAQRPRATFISEWVHFLDFLRACFLFLSRQSFKRQFPRSSARLSSIETCGQLVRNCDPINRWKVSKAEVGYDRYESRSLLARGVCPELDISSFDFVCDRAEFIEKGALDIPRGCFPPYDYRSISLNLNLSNSSSCRSQLTKQVTNNDMGGKALLVSSFDLLKSPLSPFV